jgi:hypothetical protein
VVSAACEARGQTAAAAIRERSLLFIGERQFVELDTLSIFVAVSLPKTRRLLKNRQPGWGLNEF